MYPTEPRKEKIIDKELFEKERRYNPNTLQVHVELHTFLLENNEKWPLPQLWEDELYTSPNILHGSIYPFGNSSSVFDICYLLCDQDRQQ